MVGWSLVDKGEYRRKLDFNMINYIGIWSGGFWKWFGDQVAMTSFLYTSYTCMIRKSVQRSSQRFARLADQEKVWQLLRALAEIWSDGATCHLPVVRRDFGAEFWDQYQPWLVNFSLFIWEGTLSVANCYCVGEPPQFINQGVLIRGWHSLTFLRGVPRSTARVSLRCMVKH